jgi:Putative F0F1-ATPase subunit Ca2+/Mg2+ transporter
MEDAVPPGSPSDPSPDPSSDPTQPPDRPGPGHGEPEEPGESDRLLSPGAIAFLTLGLTVALSLVAGAGLGYLIDALAHTAPLFTLVGLAFGVVVAVASTVSTIRRYL